MLFSITRLLPLSLILLCQFLATLQAAIMPGPAIAGEKQTLSVSGHAKIVLEPNHAILHCYLTSDQGTYETVMKRIIPQRKELEKRLRELGLIPESANLGDFTTWSSWLHWSFSSYRHQELILVRVDDLERLDNIQQALVGVKYLTINVQLKNDERDSYRLQAFTQATKAARKKADTIAAGLGTTITGVDRVIEEGTGSTRHYSHYNPWWGWGGHYSYQNTSSVNMISSAGPSGISSNKQPSSANHREHVEAKIRVIFRIQ